MCEEQPNELTAMQFAPLGDAIDDYLVLELEDEADYLIIRRAMTTYLEKHPNVVGEYAKKKETSIQEAQNFLVSIVEFVENHLAYIKVRIQESIEEATAKSKTFKDMNRESIIPNLLDNFTIDEAAQNDILSAVYNLTNYSGIEIGYGPDEHNSAGSILHVYIFNF